MDEIQVPTSLYVGDEYNLSLKFVNKGKTQVYNVTTELRGNMPNSGERNFIGNVASAPRKVLTSISHLPNPVSWKAK